MRFDPVSLEQEVNSQITHGGVIDKRFGVRYKSLARLAERFVFTYSVYKRMDLVEGSKFMGEVKVSFPRDRLTSAVLWTQGYVYQEQRVMRVDWHTLWANALLKSTDELPDEVIPPN